MAMNRVQFQKGLSLDGFLKHYGSEEQCEDALVATRWPEGYHCPRCECKRVAMTHNGRRLWECLGCGYQCSAIAGTIMEATKLPLRKWFLAMFLIPPTTINLHAASFDVPFNWVGRISPATFQLLSMKRGIGKLKL